MQISKHTWKKLILCWRIKRMGYDIRYCPEATVWHVGGGTLPKQNPMKTYLNFRNSLMTLYQNTLGARVYLFVFIRLILDGVAAVKFLLAGEFANIIAIVKAHWYFFTRFIAIRKKQHSLPKISHPYRSDLIQYVKYVS